MGKQLSVKRITAAAVLLTRLQMAAKHSVPHYHITLIAHTAALARRRKLDQRF
jgi:hypothetical protein